jgi:polysaccharide biosynthesis protein PslG
MRRIVGMRSVRFDVDWSQIEATQGSRDWSATDRVINAIVAHGMSPLGLVTYAPAWAANSGKHGSPSDPNLFASFAAAAATRYLGKVAMWEVWNEPNITEFWSPAPNVTAYAALLTATYSAIKTVSSGLFVVSGGLAPAADDGVDIAPLTFITGLYATGANHYLDAFGMHPYTYPYLPSDKNSFSAFQQMTQMRTIMVNGGDSAKQIWLTEFGAPTGTGPGAVTQAAQAKSIRIALQYVHTTSWMGPIFIYSMRDAGKDRANIQDNFGILHYNFVPKPAYAVVELERLTGGGFQAPAIDATGPR